MPYAILKLTYYTPFQSLDVFGLYYTLKNTGLFQPKFGSNMDKPKCWVKNVIKKFTVEVKVEDFKLHF